MMPAVFLAVLCLGRLGDGSEDNEVHNWPGNAW